MTRALFPSFSLFYYHNVPYKSPFRFEPLTTIFVFPTPLGQEAARKRKKEMKDEMLKQNLGNKPFFLGQHP